MCDDLSYDIVGHFVLQASPKKEKFREFLGTSVWRETKLPRWYGPLSRMPDRPTSNHSAKVTSARRRFVAKLTGGELVTST